MSIIKKYLLSIGLIIIAVLIAVTIHDSISVWYKKYYETSKTGLSWGILVHYSFLYIYPLVLLISSFLVFNLKKRKYFYVLPFAVFLIILFAFYLSMHPYRILLMAISMSLGYVVYLTCLLFINKKMLNRENQK